MGSASKYGPIEVFRAGNFTDMTGNTQTITEESLRNIAQGYDRDLAPAPVVIGHPETDTPAYGWVETLYVEQGVLKATLEDTVSEFADAVKAGRYKKVSISLFLPKSPANPKPGTMYLKHVGFLGAAAPAVPGLKPVKFSHASDAISFYQGEPEKADFAASDEVQRLRRQLREHEVEKLVQEGRVLPLFKDEVIAFAASLDDRETVSFSDGAEAATRKDWFMSYLARQPQVVSFGAMDLGPNPFEPREAGIPRRAAHKVPEGYQVDRSNNAIAAAAHELVRKNGISFAEAVDQVTGGMGA